MKQKQEGFYLHRRDSNKNSCMSLKKMFCFLKKNKFDIVNQLFKKNKKTTFFFQ